MTDSLVFYGKKSCITCQKAQAYLAERGIPLDVRSIETDPPAMAVLEQLVDPANIRASLNTRSAAYKAHGLGARALDQPADRVVVLQLMQADPNLIKRPVLMDTQGRVYQGFDPASLDTFLRD